MRADSSPCFCRAWRRTGALAVLSALPLFSGCLIVGPGPDGTGAVANVGGEMRSSIEHDLGAVYDATKRALARLEFTKISERQSGMDAELVFRTALDKRIVIELKKVTEKLTKIEIRVGVIGDQELSLTILQKIKAEWN
ncbi:MAG TPA: DUF3568 family protein [Lacunisphaera sp.]|nr:DUF3568 family protein [Lacunisphaera sp.]